MWTAKLVRDEIAQAYRTLARSTSGVGPKALKAQWPTYHHEFEDFVAQAENRDNRTKEPWGRPSAIEIAHMEAVLIGSDRPAWVNGRVCSYPTGRQLLIIGAMRQARGISGRDTAEFLCIPRPTFQWQRNRAAQIVADELNADGVPVW